MTITEDRQDAVVYEAGYLILPSIAEDNVAELVSKIDAAIVSAEGTKIDGENPIMIDLEYQMSKTVGARKYVVGEAWIGWTKFEMEPSRIAEVKTALEAMPEVLRLLILKVPRETTFTFAAAQAKLETEEAAKNAPVEAVEAPAEAPKEVVE